MSKSKSELRKEIKIIANSLSEDYKKSASQKITEKLFNEKMFIDSKSVLIYLSTNNEPSTKDIIDYALLNNKEVYVPICLSGNEMKICRITEDTKFKINKFGIQEPIKPVFVDFVPELVIMPCVSVSQNNERLGHGKGFYDRYLAEKTTNNVCLCFSVLVSDCIPQDKYDIKPDMTITEKFIII